MSASSTWSFCELVGGDEISLFLSLKCNVDISEAVSDPTAHTFEVLK